MEADIHKDTIVKHLTILEIIGNSTKGGMENYITKFIEKLPKEYFKIICICPFESQFTADLRSLGVEDVFVTAIDDNPEWRSIQLTVEVARLYKVDVLHAHMPKAHILAGLAGLILNKPVVATIHGMNITAFEQGVALAVQSHLITNCQEAYIQALAMGIPGEKVSNVKNGVDVALFRSGSDKPGLKEFLKIPENAPLVGYVARLEWEKGPDLFVKAATHILTINPDIHFVLVGDGNMQSELKASCKKLKLTGNVHFIGWRVHNCNIYKEMDILAHTSRSDGTSLAVLEAMATGCPVVGFGIGGVREIIENELTGYLVEKEDWETLAEKIIQLFKEPDRIEKMKKLCVQRIENHFDVSVNTKKVIEIIKRIVSSNVNVEHGTQRYVNGMGKKQDNKKVLNSHDFS